MHSEHNIVLYQATNAVNGKRYIGITQCGLRKREKRHLWTAKRGDGAMIGAAIRKYGKKNIKFSTLIVCPTYEYAKQMEVSAIAAFEPEYNLTRGGDGVAGLKLSAEARKKISDANKGSKNWLGKSHSEETKAKIRASRLSGKGGPKKGMKMNLSSEERERRRQQIIAASRAFTLGRKLTQEQIEKFSLAGSRKNSKRVICTDTGETFPSLIELSRRLRCDRRRLRKAVNAGVPHDGALYRFTG